MQAWRASTRTHLPTLHDQRKDKGLSSLRVRTLLSPVDVYCYLKARFGRPNGLFTRLGIIHAGTTDNLVHWDYQVECGDHVIDILGMTREVDFTVDADITDCDWRRLIDNIKRDYERVKAQKSAVYRSLESWYLFPNRFIAIANVCAALHAEISELLEKLSQSTGHPAGGGQRQMLEGMRQRGRELYGNCLQLRLLTPVMAEAFINMLILMLCRKEVRGNDRHFAAFMRSNIDIKIYDLPYKCAGFTKMAHEADTFGSFQTIMNRRNADLHASPDPVRDFVSMVYFDGAVPLYGGG